MANYYTPWGNAGSTTISPSSTWQNPNGYKSLQIWSFGGNITCVKCILNDAPYDSLTAYTVGQPMGDLSTINLGPGVLLTSLNLWPSSTSSSTTKTGTIAGISATTNDGQTFTIGATGSRASSPAVACSVGSGFLTGLQGTYDPTSAALSFLGFSFFKQIKQIHIDIADDQWPDGIVPSGSSPWEAEFLDISVYSNRTKVASNYNWSGSITRTDTRSIQTALTLAVDAPVTVTTRLPIIARPSMNPWLTATSTAQQNIANALTTPKTLNWSLNNALSPETSTYFQATCWRASVTAFFYCSLNVVMADGSMYQSQPGEAGGVARHEMYAGIFTDIVQQTPFQLPSANVPRVAQETAGSS